MLRKRLRRRVPPFFPLWRNLVWLLPVLGLAVPGIFGDGSAQAAPAGARLPVVVTPKVEWTPVYYKGRSYVPLNQVAAYYNFKSPEVWTKTFTLRSKDFSVEITQGEKQIRLNGWTFFCSFPVLKQENIPLMSVFDVRNVLDPILRPTDRRDPSILRTVIIDPSGGGKDKGIESSAISEKDLTLDMARILEVLLKNNGYKVILTRSEDKVVLPASRVKIANEVLEEAIYLNLRAASSPSSVKGFECSTLPPAGTPATNESDSPNIDKRFFPGNINDRESLALAATVQNSAVSQTGTTDLGVRRVRVEELRDLRMPAISCRLGYLSNKTEAAKLATKAYREELAAAMVSGIGRYADFLRRNMAERTEEDRVRPLRFGPVTVKQELGVAQTTTTVTNPDRQQARDAADNPPAAKPGGEDAPAGPAPLENADPNAPDASEEPASPPSAAPSGETAPPAAITDPKPDPAAPGTPKAPESESPPQANSGTPADTPPAAPPAPDSGEGSTGGSVFHSLILDVLRKSLPQPQVPAAPPPGNGQPEAAQESAVPPAPSAAPIPTSPDPGSAPAVADPGPAPGSAETTPSDSAKPNASPAADSPATVPSADGKTEGQPMPDKPAEDAGTRKADEKPAPAATSGTGKDDDSKAASKKKTSAGSSRSKPRSKSAARNRSPEDGIMDDWEKKAPAKKPAKSKPSATGKPDKPDQPDSPDKAPKKPADKPAPEKPAPPLPASAGDRITLRLPIVASGTAPIDRSQVELQIFLFESVNNGEIDLTTSNPPETRWLSVLPDWKAGVPEWFQAVYLRPPFTAQEEKQYGRRAYYGYVARLIYAGRVMDETCYPPNLNRCLYYFTPVFPRR